MLSLRTLGRSAPRAVARVSRAGAGAINSATRSPVNAFRSSARPSLSQMSAFSTSVLRRTPAGTVDQEISQKLASELAFEQEFRDNEPEPASIQDYLKNSPFELVDTPGKDEVVLKRKFQNETITVTFSVQDLQNDPSDMYDDQDSAMSDEDYEGGEGGEGGASGKNARNNSSESEMTDEEMDEEMDDAPGGAAAIRLNVVVEKPNKGALQIETVAQDGSLMVENMYFFDDAKLAHGHTMETEHASRGVYAGPPFGTLDEDLQALTERYLDERGISQPMAVFVADYLEQKEQKEYVNWLNKVKNFIDV